VKILIDECIDRRRLRDLSEHDVKTVRQETAPQKLLSVVG
jgi:hypothetical protein